MYVVFESDVFGVEFIVVFDDDGVMFVVCDEVILVYV